MTAALTLPDLRSVTAPIAPDPGEERALVVAAQRGDDEAFSALVRRHQRRSYAVAKIAAGREERLILPVRS